MDYESHDCAHAWMCVRVPVLCSAMDMTLIHIHS